MSNLVRTLILLFGGSVVGIGLPILVERKTQWDHMGFKEGANAALNLLIVNTLVFIYICFDIISHFGPSLTWRVPLAMSIFVSKAMMLFKIREATYRQQDELARQGKLERRNTPQRREGE